MMHLNDSVFMYGQNRRPCQRIKLNSTFLADLQNASVNYGIDYPTFLSNFKGLYIGPDTNQTGRTLPYYQLDGADTFSQAGVLVYYHMSSPDTPEVFQYPFSMAYCSHYNFVTRNYNGTPALTYMSSTAQSDSLILVQNQPGAALDLRFPTLKNLSATKMIINKAELIITQVNTNTSDIFSAPSKLYATGIDTRDTFYAIADRDPQTSLSPLAFLGGYQQQVTIAGGLPVARYIINMPREVISTILQQRELHLRINGTRDYPGAYRLVAGGRGPTVDSNYRVKLNIVYSTQTH
jgi:hypothetical protein